MHYGGQIEDFDRVPIFFGSKHQLSTILIAKVASLVRFIMHVHI